MGNRLKAQIDVAAVRAEQFDGRPSALAIYLGDL
jgi:hypothetical protein